MPTFSSGSGASGAAAAGEPAKGAEPAKPALAAAAASHKTPRPRPSTFFSLHVLVYREDDFWLAHCLEFDAVAQGGTPEQARAGLIDAIETLVSDAIEHGDEAGLYSPAPAELWRRFGQAKASEVRFNMRQLEAGAETLITERLAA